MRRRRLIIVVLSTLAVVAGLAWFVLGVGSGTAELEVTFLHYENDGYRDVAVMQVKNVGTGTATYTSESFCSTDPIFALQVESGTEWKKVAVILDCATELHASVLGAGAEKRIKVVGPSGPQRWKVGISYATATSSDGFKSFVAMYCWSLYSFFRKSGTPATDTAWSDPIEAVPQE